MVDKSKKLIFVSALALSILAASAYGVQSVYAQEPTTQSTIVQKIAQKFGLKPEEVQAVFDQERTTHQKVMEAKFEQNLTDAVTKGDLTEEKKQLILAKHKELKTYRDGQKERFSTMSKEEIRAEMTKHKEDLKKWSEENDIDLKYFLGGMGMHGKGMRWKK